MKFAVLDLETTGTQDKDRIIQIGLALIDHDRIADRYSSFVRPDMPIPETVSRMTGITDEMVADAPALDEALIGLLPFLEDAVLVAHNAAFDFGFLQRALAECGYHPFDGPVLDTLDFLRMLYPGMSSLALGRASAELGVALEQHHRADHDAEATAELFLRCLERLNGLPLLTVQRLAGLIEEGGLETRDLAWFLAEIRAERELRAAAEPAGTFYRQFALAVDDWSEEEPVRGPEETETGLNPDFSAFSAELLAKMRTEFPQYEERPSQQEMVERVHEALAGERHLMVEAGTGTGKSLAYLIPSLYYGILNEEKVVVSTHTINLQEQIRERDLPLLERLFPVPFQASVLKGRNHYLCLRKFEHKINGKEYEPTKEQRLTAAQMTVWLGETKHGDEEELHLAGNRGDFWRSVESDADSCLNRACPWFKKCFYHRARHRANQADLVITNHSLLLTDAKAEHRVLPAYGRLVIDEAHHFEEVAGKHLGTEISYHSYVNALAALARDSRNGLLPQLRYYLSQASLEESPEWTAALDGLAVLAGKIKEDWDRLADALYQVLEAAGSGGVNQESGQYVVRLKEGAMPAGWDAILLLEENLFVSSGDFARQLERRLAEWKNLDEEAMQGVLVDAAGALKDLQRQRDAVHRIVRTMDAGTVYWLEAGAYYRSKSLSMYGVPLDISPLLREHFFDRKASVVLTSATLSVGKTFQYAIDQLGLKPDEERGQLLQSILPSPFQYREQALVLIPRNFPGVSDPAFVDRLTASLHDVAVELQGRLLVLFTSYRMLKQVHEPLKESLREAGIQVLGQGIDSANRSKLVRMFQESDTSILLGTSSFWEGVDIPGDALTGLAIVRLPFQPPNHPMVEAKCEAIKEQRKNPFMAYSVPQAVIRFKQGFGRLIRTANDKGIVIVYDTRVIEAYYGKQFLYSLPGPKIEHLALDRLVPRVREWMNGSSDAG